MIIFYHEFQESVREIVHTLLYLLSLPCLLRVVIRFLISIYASFVSEALVKGERHLSKKKPKRLRVDIFVSSLRCNCFACLLSRYINNACSEMTLCVWRDARIGMKGEPIYTVRDMNSRLREWPYTKELG